MKDSCCGLPLRECGRIVYILELFSGVMITAWCIYFLTTPKIDILQDNSSSIYYYNIKEIIGGKTTPDLSTDFENNKIIKNSYEGFRNAVWIFLAYSVVQIIAAVFLAIGISKNSSPILFVWIFHKRMLLLTDLMRNSLSTPYFQYILPFYLVTLIIATIYWTIEIKKYSSPMLSPWFTYKNWYICLDILLMLIVIIQVSFPLLNFLMRSAPAIFSSICTAVIICDLCQNLVLEKRRAEETQSQRTGQTTV